MLSVLPMAVKRIIQDEIYRIYITDALKTVSENTAAISGGARLTKRYFDIINPKIEDERTGDEIADDVISAILGGGSG